jgi:outer membrane protein assembly factor BamB
MNQQTAFAVFVAVLAAAVFGAAALLHEWVGEKPSPAGPAPAGASGGDVRRAEGAPSFLSPSPASWAIFRGDGRLFGRAAGEIPSRPALRWSFKTGDAIKSSPVIEGGRAFVGSFDSQLYAVDLDSGTQAWAYKAADAFEAPPLLAGGCVYAGSLDGVFHAVNAADGKLRWTFKAGAKIVGSANVLPGAGDGGIRGILVGSHDGKMYCLDPASGRPLWAFETESYVNGAPSVAAGKIVFGGCDARVRALSGEGEELLQADAGSYVPGSVPFDGRFAYAGVYEKELLCLDLSAGTVAWRYGDASSGSPFFSSPAVGTDRVLAGSQDRKLHCVNRRDGKGLWTFTAKGNVDGSPVICGGKVVFGSADGRLYVLRLADGSLDWSYEIGAPITASPAVAGGMILVGSEDGRLWAFGE